jgi:4-diphosphocytidyl-2-C-methyl-D-erythritol kinase
MGPRVLCARAPAKINLGLFLGPTRPDGRHELVTVMQSISLADELRLEELPGLPETSGAPGAPGVARDEVICPGLPGPPEENLAFRALAAFRAGSGWDGPRVRLGIEKRVPVAAGLGGGSGDAAAALRLAAASSSGSGSGSAKEGLLVAIACDLGADVPAQVRPGRWLARGAGEVLSALGDPEPPFGVLVLPGEGGLSTGAVYAEADRLGLGRSEAELEELAEALRASLADGAGLPPTGLLHNDLQGAACSLCPAIEPALARVRGLGAGVAVVSGSGPTVLGLFGGAGGPERAQAAARELRGAFAARPVGESFGRVVECG